MAELHDPFGAGHAAQLMGAEVGQPRVGRQRVRDQGLGDAREHGLAAVGQVA